MRNFIATILLLCCFGIAKAHFLPKNFKTLKPQIEIRNINSLPNYNVTFKVYKTPVKRWIKKNKIEMVNAIAIETSRTEIAVSPIQCLRLRSGTGFH
ncbi:MAG: hypothetical protein IPJ32_02295 [Sphingobacteriaceae bacterium]|nr:hypothetical protein [Sphingobacteriaceae bacterium]